MTQAVTEQVDSSEATSAVSQHVRQACKTEGSHPVAAAAEALARVHGPGGTEAGRGALAIRAAVPAC